MQNQNLDDKNKNSRLKPKNRGGMNNIQENKQNIDQGFGNMSINDNNLYGNNSNLNYQNMQKMSGGGIFVIYYRFK